MPSPTGPVPTFASAITARIWRLFLVALLALVLFIGVLLWDMWRIAAVRRTIPQYEGIERNLRMLGEDLLDGESAQRGYLLTQDERYLQSYRTAAADAHDRQLLLRGLMTDPAAAAITDRLDAVVNNRLNDIDSTVTLARSGAHAAALRIVLGGDGDRMMAQFRALRAEAVGLEIRQLVDRRAAIRSIMKQLLWTLVGGVLAMGSLLFAYTRRTTRTLGQPIRNLLQAIQAVGSGELNQRLAISTADEIGEIATALNGMTDRLVDARNVKDQALKELQRANEALRENNEKFRIMVDGVTDYAIIMLDAQGLVSGWNSGAERLKGWRDDEIIGRHFSTLYPPVDVAAGKPDRELLIAERDARVEDEGWRVRKDGSRFFANVVITPMRDQAGTLVGFVKVTHDITGRRDAEERLARQDALLAATSRMAGVGGWEYDAGAKSLAWSDIVYAIRELPPGEPPQLEQALEFYPPGAREVMANALDAAIASATPFDLIVPFVTAKDSRRWVRVIGEPEMRDGQAVRVIGAFQDVTVMRESEEVLRAARDAAESASRAKSEFLANMSHEIRTPLNGVIGMTGLLLESSLNSDQRECAEIARSSGESLLALINNILDFSKIESGSLELESIDFDLRDLIDESVDGIALEAAKKQLEVLVDVDAGCPRFVRGDPTRLRQILLNLLSNAVKFTNDGDVTVTVTPTAAAPAGRLGLAVAVQDSGIGIAADRIGRLFTPFTQADASTTRRHGGTGLGLSICRRLITAMGGEISVDSVAERGTTFNFTILLDPGAETVSARKLRLIGPIRVLVVDDHAASRRILGARLQQWGILVQTAGSAEEALQCWDAMATAGEVVDVAIVDHQLPDQDAEWLAWQLRGRDRDGRCKLVLLSSLTSRFRNRGRGPFDRALAKPVKGDALFRLMSELTVGQLAPSSIEAIETAPFEGLRALLVDDNPVNQKLGERLLGRLGFQVTQAWNGRQALQHLQVQLFDVVMMDCQMPDMDGYETTRMLRQCDSGVLDCSVPVIAMTANALAGDRDRCLAAGMNDYLAKPINTGQLRAALHAVLAKSQGAAPPVGDRAGSDDTGVLDTAGLRQQFEGDLQFIDELLQTFADSALDLMAQIQAAAAAHDTATLTRLAHQLRGASAGARAGALERAASALELASEDQRTPRVEKLKLAWSALQPRLRSALAPTRTAVLQ
jgi:PAS domain S-box-containing protein